MAAEAAPSFLWLPDLAPEGSVIALPPAESHYVARVCRAKPGERLRATNGRGGLAEMTVVESGREVLVRYETRTEQPRAREGHVLCGAPEGERADWLVEKLAELGIAVFQPVDCERGRWGVPDSRVDRWRRLAVAGLRQSQRLHLMEVRAPLPIESALAGLPAGTRRWRAAADAAASVRMDVAPSDAVVIGPAAGFSAAEGERLTGGGFIPIRLADARLRTETAALCWAAAWASL